MKGQGFAVAPGSHTLVGMKKFKECIFDTPEKVAILSLQ